jgi:FAD:protein FMN transferase
VVFRSRLLSASAVGLFAALVSPWGCRERAVEPDPTPKAVATSDATLPVPAAKVVDGQFTAMGTAITFKVWTDREVAARAAMEDALAEIRRIETMMTTWSETSEVSKINAAAGGAPVTVSPELIDVLDGARAIHDASSGVFDITFYGLKGLWKFDQDATSDIPSEAAIKARLPLVDGKQVTIDHAAHTVTLPKKGMLINLGGIAKGYAVDKAAAVLAKNGFSDVVVQAGGDLLVKGRKGEAPWTVGIRDPRGAVDDFFALAPITDASFSTAGDYERAFVKDGKRYHHILDPRTGHPATACRSVTILAKDAFTADELDDAVFILGVEKGLPLIEAREGVGAVIVTADNQVVVSKRLEGKITIVHPPTAGI